MQVTIKRSPTGDRGPPGLTDMMTIDILTSEQLGPKMSKLPNGSLLCRDVPIARVGWMIYGPGETPIPVGESGVAYIERTADDLFDPDTIGSFMAAAVTDDHPYEEEGVVPANWQKLAKGFSTQNVRRGTGADSDVLLADIVVTDAKLIEDILGGKREVSCGYDADYISTGPGMGRQTKILGNHIALVKKGRCGPRCAIGDRALQSPTEGIKMKRTEIKGARREVDPVALEAARATARDAQAALDALENPSVEDEPGAVHVHIHGSGDGDPKPGKTEDRMAALETTVSGLATTVDTLVKTLTPTKDAATLAAEKAAADAIAASQATAAAALLADKEDEKDATGKTLDSAALQTSFTELMANAEVLVPGFKAPTFDAAAKRKATVDQMCQTRRRCLDLAYATTEGAALIDSIGGTKDLDLSKLDCANTAILFNAAAMTRKAINNRAATGDKQHQQQQQQVAGPKALPTAIDMNKAAAEFWSKQNATTPAA